ncbi:ATP-binding cassette domain-containing protein [Streptomyces sp. Je 1-369]|uniref:ATP-binding cassette domain-containing protein n=1 Tax=Streptomyces sp. Je 1-369 TaxID=2966192 RepID=UPI002286AD94|nr:ATP-binding cassette domain-containing protein [Streptomyces sp. Je 1-369]WAL98306.1 ATP-binding cassette domain-containing protein [Streptomyces sp. Je 1-369]
MIQAIGLTSNPRQELPPAVEDVSFEARTGRVTALLDAEPIGTTTALRLMLELQQGRGITYFRGRPLHRIAHPSREVGVLMGDVPGHPARSVRGHLRMLCAAMGVPVLRADDVLEAVGLVSLRDERLGTLSRGMDRRLGLACALLADPHTLVLDRPGEGLSARESAWLHGILRAHAAQGGTVLFATNDPKEAARAADRVVTLDSGQLVADQDAPDFARTRLRPRVAVRTPHAARLGALLTKEARTGRRAIEVVKEDGNRLSVYGSTCADVGETAYRHGILVHQLADELGDAGPQNHTRQPDGRDGQGGRDRRDRQNRENRQDRQDREGRPEPEAPPSPIPAPASAPEATPTTAPEASPETTPTTTPESPPEAATQPHADVRPVGSSTGATGAAEASSDAPDDTPAEHSATGRDDDTAPHDSTSHDTTPQETAPHDSTPHETAPQETAPHDSTPHRTAPHDSAPHDTMPLDTTPLGTSTHRSGAPTGILATSQDTAATPATASATATATASATGSASTTASALPPPITVRPGRSPLHPLRYEVRRLLGVGTGYFTLAAVLATSALFSVFLARSGHTAQPYLLAAWPHELPLPPAALGAGLLGALAFGDEFRHPALAADRGTVPRRLGMLGAKLLVAAAVALLLSTLAVVSDAVLLHLVYGEELTKVPADWPSLTASWYALVTGCAWAGVLAAGVFRSTTAGLAAVLAVPIVVVPLVQKAVEGPSVRSAAGLPARLRDLALVQWPFGAERYLAAGVRMIAQPVGTALMLSLTALLCAYLLTAMRTRVR